MKKIFPVFIGMLVLGIATLCVLPGYILQESDQVQMTEQVLLGDPAIVEGVTIKGYNHYNGNLFWNTTYVAGKDPEVETEYRFSASQEYASLSPMSSWQEERGYDCMQWSGVGNGGWGVSGGGGLSLDRGSIKKCGLTEAYEALEKETKAGEEKEKTVYLNDYIDYYPVEIVLRDTQMTKHSFDTEEWGEAYTSLFKVPLQSLLPYTIELEKNEKGEIVSIGGGTNGVGFHWNMASVCTDTDIYFTFCPYFAGKRIENSISRGGFGIYRQPYSNDKWDTILYPEQLELFYPLAENFYEGRELLLDINEDNQMVIITDTETETRLRVIDLETGKLVEEDAFSHESEKMNLADIARATEEFLVLQYEDNYYAVIERQGESGYEHRMTFQVERGDLLHSHDFTNENAMDWDGKRLLFASYGREENRYYDLCDFELAVYDKTGQIYHGKYRCSLMSEQERQPGQDYESEWDAINSGQIQHCEPRTAVSMEVTWP